MDTPDGATLPGHDRTSAGTILGMYFRLLVPERSRVDAVSGGSTLPPVTNPAVVEDEAGRTAIGTYLKVPPGRRASRTTWTSPYAADADETGGTYRLTIQAQPGMLPGPLTLTIRAPDGYRITAASPELVVHGGDRRRSPPPSTGTSSSACSTGRERIGEGRGRPQQDAVSGAPAATV